MTTLKEKLLELLETLEGLDRNREFFGMVHFDYSDGNYMIDAFEVMSFNGEEVKYDSYSPLPIKNFMGEKIREKW